MMCGVGRSYVSGGGGAATKPFSDRLLCLFPWCLVCKTAWRHLPLVGRRAGTAGYPRGGGRGAGGVRGLDCPVHNSGVVWKASTAFPLFSLRSRGAGVA